VRLLRAYINPTPPVWTRHHRFAAWQVDISHTVGTSDRNTSIFRILKQLSSSKVKVKCQGQMSSKFNHFTVTHIFTKLPGFKTHWRQ